MTEKPVAIILPTWNPQEPRFTIKECERCSDDRVFKNNQCIYNQRLGFAYSVEEIVEVLNALGKENEELKTEIKRLKKQWQPTPYEIKIMISLQI